MLLRSTARIAMGVAVHRGVTVVGSQKGAKTLVGTQVLRYKGGSGAQTWPLAAEQRRCASEAQPLCRAAPGAVRRWVFPAPVGVRVARPPATRLCRAHACMWWPLGGRQAGLPGTAGAVSRTRAHVAARRRAAAVARMRAARSHAAQTRAPQVRACGSDGQLSLAGVEKVYCTGEAVGPGAWAGGRQNGPTCHGAGPAAGCAGMRREGGGAGADRLPSGGRRRASACHVRGRPRSPPARRPGTPTRTPAAQACRGRCKDGHVKHQPRTNGPHTRMTHMCLSTMMTKNTAMSTRSTRMQRAARLPRCSFSARTSSRTPSSTCVGGKGVGAWQGGMGVGRGAPQVWQREP